MKKHHVHIILKNGREIYLTCEEFTVKKSGITGRVDGISWKGEVSARPLYLDFEEVAAIIQSYPDEEGELNEN